MSKLWYPSLSIYKITTSHHMQNMWMEERESLQRKCFDRGFGEVVKRVVDRYWETFLLGLHPDLYCLHSRLLLRIYTHFVSFFSPPYNIRFSFYSWCLLPQLSIGDTSDEKHFRRGGFLAGFKVITRRLMMICGCKPSKYKEILIEKQFNFWCSGKLSKIGQAFGCILQIPHRLEPTSI